MLNAERAHDLALSALERASASPSICRGLSRMHTRPTPTLAVRAFGLSFPNVIGLAAGLDKNGRGLPALASLGFGFLEVGTVTPRPQGGNPKPRMWRLPNDHALINRLGFNNEGAATLRQRLTDTGSRLPIPLGVNIGKNASTPLEDSFHDYDTCLQLLHPWADYIVINVSSPNTPGLRSLQHATQLDELLRTMRDKVDALPETLPLLVKIAPDLSIHELDDIAQACLNHRIDGIIATNTTVRRDGMSGSHAAEAGGLSGAPLTTMSTRIVAALYRRVRAQIPIVGVGGVMNAEDVYDKIKAGATLVQVLTGFIYEGPSFPRRLAQGLEALLLRDGFHHVSEAIGIEAI